jgi:hypothetical protein
LDQRFFAAAATGASAADTPFPKAHFCSSTPSMTRQLIARLLFDPTGRADIVKPCQSEKIRRLCSDSET